jgi:hypothetical protein
MKMDMYDDMNMNMYIYINMCKIHEQVHVERKYCVINMNINMNVNVNLNMNTYLSKNTKMDMEIDMDLHHTPTCALTRTRTPTWSQARTWTRIPCMDMAPGRELDMDFYIKITCLKTVSYLMQFGMRWGQRNVVFPSKMFEILYQGAVPQDKEKGFAVQTKLPHRTADRGHQGAIQEGETVRGRTICVRFALIRFRISFGSFRFPISSRSRTETPRFEFHIKDGKPN